MEKVIVLTEPASQVTEAYRALCTNVLAVLNRKNAIEITGVAETGNSSLVAANLAAAISQAGKTVLLVDCNLRKPQQHEIFGLQNIGVTNCITSGEHYKTYIQATRQENLFVLTAGGTVTNPAEALLSATMNSLLTDAKETFDIILLDVPSVSKVADAVALGTKTDGVLLVLANKKDKVEQAQKAKEMFNRAGVPILGCVLDKS